MSRDGTGWAILGLTVRRTWPGAVATAAAVVLVTVTAVVGYVAAYPDPADRVVLAASIGSNPGMVALFGEPRALETVAGFTEWRVLLVLALVGGVWALFAATRTMRGEEDAGRAEILLAAPISRAGVARATAAGLAVVLGLLTAVAVGGLVVGAGRELGTDRAALLGVAVGGIPAIMAGVGAVCSQLVDSRRRAAGLGAIVLGLWYVVRVVADSTPDLRWLRWATPLGWLELAAPLTAPSPWPVALTWATGLLLGLAALVLSRRRDLGAGLVRGRDDGRARTALLASPWGLALRLSRGAALAWSLGMGTFGLLVGLVARTAAEAMAGSTSGSALGGLGIADTGTRAYVGLSFVLATVALATAAAGLAAATREEEGSARLDTILVRPVDRARWLASRLLAAVAVLVLASAALVAGIWTAGRVGDLGVEAGDLALAGVNMLPAALLVLGAGTLVHGLLPRRTATLTYGGVAASFLLEVVGSTVDLPGWLLGLSVFHHVAPAPAVDPDWPAALVLLSLAVVTAAAGAVALRRRDVEPA
ncbi:ABC transporter permease subunit [Actinotalea sp.]|uniref:ABC transporter permease subunit n=1 Tax=Actinotalea sp. TaxID=1872145 RepID=UPI003562BC91